MKMKCQKIYNDSVIEVALIDDNENNSIKNIAMKYLKPKDLKKSDGSIVFVTNAMGGETDWFILPFTFGAAIGKKLFEQYYAGLIGFDSKGIVKLKEWLIDMEIIDDAMCY
jgi:hypothetical protein